MTRFSAAKLLSVLAICVGLLAGAGFAHRAEASSTAMYCGSRDVDCGCFSAGYCTGNWPSGADCSGSGSECDQI